jgi:uncharacterized repeat protein (TIGR01451 family)
MMASKVVVRSITLMAAVCCLAGFGAHRASAQSVVTSPTHVSLGVPAVLSSSPLQTVSLVVTGSGSITVSSVSIAAISPAVGTTPDFAITSDNCTGVQVTAPGVCTVGLTFTPQAAGLRTATLNFQYPNGDGTSTVQVPLNGAAGAIKLFDSMLVEPSAPGTPGPTPPGKAVKSNTLNLSCPNTDSPAGIIARLSSLPDGSGKVFQDNLIQIVRNADPANVCAGGTGDGGFNSCFQQSYESVAGSFLNKDPDTTPVGDGTFTGTYGVAPIDISSFLVPGSQTLEFDLVDVGLPPSQSGAFLGASTLHLVTNCTASSVTTGGTITGNPLDPGNPASLIQDFPFNTNPNTHITFSANFVAADTFDANGPATPNTKDTGILQSAFPPMVQGTSVAPAVCIRLNGEESTDGLHTKLCKAFTITCTDPVTGVSAGKNCPQKQAVAAANALFFETKLDSPDAPVIAPGTGPGLLEGTDTWATTLPLAPCSTDTPALFPNDDGEESGQLCPQNPLTEFKGTGDPISGSTPRGVNSTFIPVLNVPLPFSTFTTTPPTTAAGWVNSRTVTINFTSNPAAYSGPNPNGFTPAPIASLTYGTQTPVPDPTFPVSGDVTNSNPAGTGACPSIPVAPFNSSTAPINFGADGVFSNVHYFATDCARTEELVFTPSADPNQNWASFKTATIKIDTVAPTISAITFNPSSTGNIFASGQIVHPLFTCNDDRSGIASCLGTGGVAGDGSGILNTTGTGTKTFTVTATDNAGNVTTSSPVTYQVVGSSELVIFNLTKLTVNAGTSLAFRFGVINFGPAVANNVVFKTTLPAGVTFSSAGFGTVTCVPGSCADIPAPPNSCSVASGVVTCNIPTVGLITKLTGVLVKITVNVPSNATVGSIIKDTATVKAANSDPISFDNTATSATQVCSTSGRCPH